MYTISRFESVYSNFKNILIFFFIIIKKNINFDFKTFSLKSGGS